MADFTQMFLQGLQAGQSQKDAMLRHEKETEDRNLQRQMLKHQMDRLKIEDQVKAREMALKFADERKKFEGPMGPSPDTAGRPGSPIPGPPAPDIQQDTVPVPVPGVEAFGIPAETVNARTAQGERKSVLDLFNQQKQLEAAARGSEPMTPYQQASLAQSASQFQQGQATARRGQDLAAERAAKPVKMDYVDPATGQARTGFFQFGADGKLTPIDSVTKPLGATMERNTHQAETVYQTGEEILAKLKEPKLRSQLGPVLGRYNTLRDFIGNPPPELAELAGNIESYSLANMGVHGMRSAEGAKQIQKFLDVKATPDTLIAKIKGLNEFSKRFAENARGKSSPGTTTKSGYTIVEVK